jgi:hypothetical protein
VEAVLKGEVDIIWGILNELRNAYPCAMPKDRLIEFEKINLPYS